MKRAQEVFVYLMRFTLFSICLWGVLDVVFAIINKLVPIDGAGHETRLSVSALTIVLPLYVAVLAKNGRDLTKTPALYESGIRKVFLYVTIFMSAMTGIVSGIAIVYGLLGGGQTANWFCKLGAVVTLSVILFFDYSSSLRPPSGTSTVKGKLLWVVLAAVLAIYATGLVFALQHRV